MTDKTNEDSPGKGGRPTKYNDEIVALACDYVDNFKSDPKSDDGEVVPTIAGLSLHIGVSRETVYDWINQEEKRQFSDIVKKLMAKQEQMLVAKGLIGDFNASITKLALTKHDYSDRQVTDMNLDLSKLSIEQLEAIASGGGQP